MPIDDDHFAEIARKILAALLTLRQRQATREALEIYLEQLRTSQREGTYSQINAKRIEAISSMLELLPFP